jgi:hypothetical protein
MVLQSKLNVSDGDKNCLKMKKREIELQSEIIPEEEDVKALAEHLHSLDGGNNDSLSD